jgi:hypothetical protein
VKTITIDTSDHGTVTFAEPDWCAGDRHRQVGPPARRSETAHQSAPVDVTVATPGGDAVLLRLALWQDVFPQPEWAMGDQVHAVATLVDDDVIEFDVPGLDQLANAMAAAGRQVAEFANRLALQQPRGGER